MKEKETIGRKRLRLAKKYLPTIISPQNDFECMKEAKRYLHRTQDPENAHKHKSIVCVICDWFIIRTEKIHYLSKENISAHTQRLSVESYERYYETVLVPEVRNQYMINDGNLKELLLSLLSRKNWKGLTKCTLCGIVSFKLNTFLVMFLQVPSIGSTCFPHTWGLEGINYYLLSTDSTSSCVPGDQGGPFFFRRDFFFISHLTLKLVYYNLYYMSNFYAKLNATNSYLTNMYQI